MNTPDPLDLDPDYVPIPVDARCPMCGSRLELDIASRLRCTMDGGEDNGFVMCSDIFAAQKLLAEPELTHIVRIEGDRFHLKHPLHERINDRLLTCSFHAEITASEADDLPSGEYTVTRDELGQLDFEARS